MISYCWCSCRRARKWSTSALDRKRHRKHSVAAMLTWGWHDLKKSLFSFYLFQPDSQRLVSAENKVEIEVVFTLNSFRFYLRKFMSSIGPTIATLRFFTCRYDFFYLNWVAAICNGLRLRWSPQVATIITSVTPKSMEHLLFESIPLILILKSFTDRCFLNWKFSS